MKSKRQELTRRQKYTYLSAVITLTVVIAIVLLNAVTTYFTNLYPLSIDLTKEQAFKITSQTKEYLEELAIPINIKILNSKEGFMQGGNYYKQAQSVLEQYEQTSSNVTLEYIDILKNPSTAAQYDGLNVSINDIIISGGERTRTLTAYDLFNIESSYYGDYIVSSKAEQSLTSAIMGVSTNDQTKVGMLSGHGERIESGLENLLTLNNFEVARITPAIEDIPEDIDVLIWSSPTNDPDENVIEKLNKHLSKEGKSLLYFADVSQPNMSNLTKFLSQWGISVDSGTIIETDSTKTVNFNPYLSTTALSDGSLSGTMRDPTIPLTMPFSKPMSVLYSQSMGRYTTVLMHTTKTSAILPVDAPEDWQPTSQDLGTAFPIAILSQEHFENNSTSQVVAFGSADSLTESILGSGSFGNSEFYLSAMNTLTNREDVIAIESKSLGGKELGISTAQALTLGIGFMIGLPTAMILIGVTIWYQHRHG